MEIEPLWLGDRDFQGCTVPIGTSPTRSYPGESKAVCFLPHQK